MTWEVCVYVCPLLSERRTSMSFVAMSWKVNSDVLAPKAAMNSRSSPGSPACTGVWEKDVPLLVDVATLTDPRFKLATYRLRSEERRVGKECRCRWSA